MKKNMFVKVLCIILSLGFALCCLTACVSNGGSNGTSSQPVSEEETESQAPEAEDVYLKPTQEELDKLINCTWWFGNYDCNADNAVELAYKFGICEIPMYNEYCDGKAFEKAEAFETDTLDPLEQFAYCKDGDDYLYNKFPADSVDKFMKEILNVEPDREMVLKDEEGRTMEYYYDGYYYGCSGLFGTGWDLNVTGVKDTADGWNEVEIAWVDIDGNIDSTYTVIAKIIELDGERYWTVRTVDGKE